MLKNRKSTLAKAVKHHYKKQEIFLMEAQKNTERRKVNLSKIKDKLQVLISGGNQTEHKLERFEEEFININRSYDSPFHQFKNCTVGLNPQIANTMFESIGNLKYPIVQFSNRNTYKFFNNKFKAITRSYFFGDSNNPDLILMYDFQKDLWIKKEVSIFFEKLINSLGAQKLSLAILFCRHRTQRWLYFDHWRIEQHIHQRVRFRPHVQHRKWDVHRESIFDPVSIHTFTGSVRKFCLRDWREVHQRRFGFMWAILHQLEPLGENLQPKLKTLHNGSYRFRR